MKQQFSRVKSRPSETVKTNSRDCKAIHMETGEPVTTNDVMTEAGRLEIAPVPLKNIIDNLCSSGRLIRPRWDQLSPV